MPVFHHHRRNPRALGLPAAFVALAFAAAPAAAAETLTLDLNKLEAKDGACRVTMVVTNGHAARAETLKADLVVFGADGVVARRLAVDLGPVAASKTIVKIFDVPALGCEAIGSVLLNDMPACHFAGDGAPAACLEAATLTSRAGPRFFK